MHHVISVDEWREGEFNPRAQVRRAGLSILGDLQLAQVLRGQHHVRSRPGDQRDLRPSGADQVEAEHQVLLPLQQLRQIAYFGHNSFLSARLLQHQDLHRHSG